MPVPDAILQLIQRFSQQIDSYHVAKYNETQTRREFIDPFFRELGWDVDNSQNYAEAYKDVIHEDAIKMGGFTKAPDYAFRIGGTRKFFLEAKKPSVNVKDDLTPAFQLRRYAWTAKLPLSILTDFEELAVYDCRQKPDKQDKASTGRILYLNYKEYAERWDEIAAIFSKDAILKGSFDRYAEAAKGKRGTTDVDDAFLAEIEKWRDLLAHNIALRNPALSQRELNYAVQMTVDRIIFLRICEDRGIESYGRLQALINGSEIYPRLVTIFRYADQRYNSGLFHFNPEKSQEDSPDELTPALQIDDKTLKEIIGSLYYPESPYEFSVLPANILGQVYEQFLGKVIRLTAGHHAVVEDKPEVKKAGGVYYTPTYIVEYIVKHTVGALLQGKKPGDMGVGRGEPLRVLDPACGSGSFLLGAYQYLLDWYRDGYVADGAEKWIKGRKPTLYQSAGSEWKLTTAERKRILLDHIYGVDIDAQAVEVTKLSLLLKVLEGESEQSLQSMLDFYKERVLPNLGQNIKCGNSLIGPDFYGQATQMALFDSEEQYRINAFDWQREFGQVFMHSGGFDAVIGNPPYIRIQALKEWAPKEVEFYKTKYQSASKGNYDIYVVFVEKGLILLNQNGLLGFILPHKFLTAQYGEPLKLLLNNGNHIKKLVHFGDKQVFENATTYTCIMFLSKTGNNNYVPLPPEDLGEFIRTGGKSADNTEQIDGIYTHKDNTSETVNKLLNKFQQYPTKLSTVADRIFQGLVTGSDSVFLLKNLDHGEYFSVATEKKYSFEPELIHPLCKGSINIKRYSVSELEKSILFPYKLIDGKASLIIKAELSIKYPIVWKYLEENKSTLEAREHGKWKHDKWYAFGRSQNLSEMEQIKILTPSIANVASFTLDRHDNLYFVGSGGGYGVTIKPFEKLSYEYLLGLLNSKCLDFYLKTISSTFSGGYFAYNRQYIEQLPIRTIDFSNPADVKQHDRMVSLVERMLTLHKQAAAATLPQEKAMLQRQIETADHEIDRLVYELYGLTADEIKIVEGETSNIANKNS